MMDCNDYCRFEWEHFWLGQRMVDFGGSLPPGVKQLLTSFEKASTLRYSLKNY